MKKKKKDSGKRRAKKASDKDPTFATQPSPFSDDRTGYSILPDRDLKKILGCG
jgi:hypothetical protein